MNLNQIIIKSKFAMQYKSYNIITESLNKKVNILENKVKILDRLRTSNGVATKEDMQFMFQLDGIKDIEKEMKGHSGAIQKDNFSCAIFSIQDLNTMSKLGSTLGEYLPQIIQSDIAKLHPRFVKNSQSMQTISNNLSAPRNSTLKVSKDEDLKEYTDKYSINTVEQKKRNYAITYKTLKYLNAAQKELTEAFKSGGNELVKDIIQKRTGGIIFEESKYHFNNIKIKCNKNQKIIYQLWHDLMRVGKNLNHHNLETLGIGR